MRPGRADGMTVVGEAGRALVGELAHLRQLRALLALRDRREEADGNVRVRARLLDQRAEHRGGVDDRLGVRHREDRAVAAGGGGRGAGRDRLLVLAARACAGARAGRRTPARARGPAPSTTRCALRSSDVPIAAITPSSTRTSTLASTPSAGSRTRAPVTTSESFGAVFAWSITRLRAASRRGLDEHRPVREQVVEHRHPHDEAGAHLRHDQRVLVVGDASGRSRRRGSSGPGA